MSLADIEIWRTAKILITHHGEDAHLVAAERADAMLNAGDFEGLRVWQRILSTIVEWRRPCTGEPVN
jgi:hypothetical protein